MEKQARDDLQLGQIVLGKYRLVRQLGAGGMCVVYEAEHVNLAQSIALKVLKPELAEDPSSVARFEREARAAAQLRGTNVARVFDVDVLEPSGLPCMSMELLVGNDLAVEINRIGSLPVRVAVDYLRQAMAGVAEAHSLGIVHRDLKPENMFLTDLGTHTDRKLLKLLDFGIAMVKMPEGARRLTAPDVMFGTVDYMSPEQIRSASNVDHRTDIWSLGIILYELLTGRTPYAGDARSVIAQIVSDPIAPLSAPHLPENLVRVVQKALAKDRSQRYQTVREFDDALAPFSDLESIGHIVARVPPESIPRRTGRHETWVKDGRLSAGLGRTKSRPVQRRSLKLVVFSVLAVAASVAVLGWALSYRRAVSLDAAAVAPPPPTPFIPAVTTAPSPITASSVTAEEPATKPAEVASVSTSAPAPARTRPAAAATWRAPQGPGTVRPASTTASDPRIPSRL